MFCFVMTGHDLCLTSREELRNQQAQTLQFQTETISSKTNSSKVKLVTIVTLMSCVLVELEFVCKFK
jgi:hypothetical protein